MTKSERIEAAEYISTHTEKEYYNDTVDYSAYLEEWEGLYEEYKELYPEDDFTLFTLYEYVKAHCNVEEERDAI